MADTRQPETVTGDGKEYGPMRDRYWPVLLALTAALALAGCGRVPLVPIL